MVGNYKRKTKIAKYSKQDLNNAIEDVKAKRLSLRYAAKAYNISKSALHRHMNDKVSNPDKVKLGRF